MAVINPTERKLAKRTLVQCTYILNCQKHFSQLDHLSEFICGELRPNCTTQGNESGYALKWSSSKFDNWVALFKGAPQDRTPHWFDDFFEDDVWTGLALGKLWTVDTNIAKKRQNFLGLDENSMMFLLLYCFFLVVDKSFIHKLWNWMGCTLIKSIQICVFTLLVL